MQTSCKFQRDDEARSRGTAFVAGQAAYSNGAAHRRPPLDGGLFKPRMKRLHGESKRFLGDLGAVVPFQNLHNETVSVCPCKRYKSGYVTGGGQRKSADTDFGVDAAK